MPFDVLTGLTHGGPRRGLGLGHAVRGSPPNGDDYCDSVSNRGSMPRMSRQARILTALSRTGHRLTGPRRQLAVLVDERRGHFTAEELLAVARRRRRPLARATVFRGLELLEELQLIERVDLPSGAHAYVRCEMGHHHHLVCASCGLSVEVAEQTLDGALLAAARQTGYRLDFHRLELFGTCPECLAAGREMKPDR